MTAPVVVQHVGGARYTRIPAVRPLPGTPPPDPAGLTVDDLVYFKIGAPLRPDEPRYPGYGAHERKLGISNQGRDWSPGAVPKVAGPYPMTYGGITYNYHNAWMECVPSSGGMPAQHRDVRIQVELVKLLHLVSGTWVDKKPSPLGNPTGGYWNGGTTYSKTISWKKDVNWRVEPSGGNSFDCKPMTLSSGQPKDDSAILHGSLGDFFPRIKISPATAVAIIARMRLITDNPAVDLTKARFTGGVSGDAYETATTSVGSNGRNPSLTHPRHKILTADWTWVGMVTGTEAQIRAYPTAGLLT